MAVGGAEEGLDGAVGRRRLGPPTPRPAGRGKAALPCRQACVRAARGPRRHGSATARAASGSGASGRVGSSPVYVSGMRVVGVFACALVSLSLLAPAAQAVAHRL